MDVKAPSNSPAEGELQYTMPAYFKSKIDFNISDE